MKFNVLTKLKEKTFVFLKKTGDVESPVGFRKLSFALVSSIGNGLVLSRPWKINWM